MAPFCVFKKSPGKPGIGLVSRAARIRAQTFESLYGGTHLLS